MKYLLLVCTDPRESIEPTTDGPSPDAWLAEMIARGVYRDGDRLRPANEATTVRIRNQELVVTDGPFAETKESLNGFDIIDCADLAEAIEIASKHPVAQFGMIEVRPFWDWDNDRD